MAIEAQLAWGEAARDDRGGVRRSLRLEVQGSRSGHGSIRAVIHNISATGILIQSDVGLTIGEIVNIELPDAGVVTAHVLWAGDEFFGCEFPCPISPSAISAALLRAPFDRPMGREANSSFLKVLGQADVSTGQWESSGVGLLDARTRAWTIAISAVSAWAVVGLCAALVIRFS